MAFSINTAQESCLILAPDSDIDSDLNWFMTHYEEFVPNEMGNHHEFFSDNQIPLSDLEEIESLRNEMDNSEHNNVHSVELEDDAIVEDNFIDFNSLEENEHMDHGTKHNLPVENGHEERVNMNGSEEIEHMEYGRCNLRPENEDRGETTADEVDKQMHVNETTTVDHNCSQGVIERRCGITLKDLQQQFGKKVADAAESLGVSRSTFKRVCRANGIARWSRKQLVQQPASASQSMATIFESDNSMSIKASYNGVNVRFPLSLSSGKRDLEVEVEKRFGVRTGSFRISYEDDEKEWIRITCDKDLHHGMHTCIERGITTMKMLVNCDLG
ncbi:protein NLP6-like isoform X2 [Lycium barbarum]|uniref:protein NLP6-like isoform X2 n=1 Tax=Lycium barbarum TaxID=112863 RepID=UPI00293E0ED3|nr:protein NLP6-like isoform X2 [Lycium barbarum]